MISAVCWPESGSLHNMPAHSRWQARLTTPVDGLIRDAAGDPACGGAVFSRVMGAGDDAEVHGAQN